MTTMQNIIKKITLYIFLIGCKVLFAQVGIGTPIPDASTQLDIVADDKGILIPRIDLTGSMDLTTIGNGNIESLLVYNTATIADVTPGYYYWNGAKWLRLASGINTGMGTPTASNPINPNAGDIYVDETTGEIYTFNGTNWIGSTKVTTGSNAPTALNPVNPNMGDIYVDETTGKFYIFNGTNWIGNTSVTTGASAPTALNPANPNMGDIYVDETTGKLYIFNGTDWIGNTSVTTGNGAPTALNPVNPSMGDIYVDETTGKLYIFNGTNWIGNTSVTTGNGAPTALNPANPSAGDIYVDEATGVLYTFDGSDWINITAVSNGITKSNGIIQLGGSLIQATQITTNLNNTLAFTGLQATDLTNELTDQDEILMVNTNTGILTKTSTSNLFQEAIENYNAVGGQTQFTTPVPITDINKVNVYRNGVRLDFTMIDANTIQLENGVVCYQNDLIRIVQFY